MIDNPTYKPDDECVDILRFIFKDAEQFYAKKTPNGFLKSDLVLFLHPSPEQQYEEDIRMRDNINRLTKKSKQEDENINISDFKQDDLTDISGYNEFLYILGLSIYDIFSNNYEVIGYDKPVRDYCSFGYD